MRTLITVLLTISTPLAAQLAETWVARYNGPANRYDEATAIAVDRIGNVYVTGLTSLGPDIHSYATVKYAGTTGQQLWASTYTGGSYPQDSAAAIAVDPDGNVYVTGRSRGHQTGINYATVKYDGTTGAELWVSRYHGSWYHDEARALAVDRQGDVCVTGYSAGEGSRLDYTTVKYDGATGAELWVARYNGTGTGWDGARAVAVDPDGNLLVTGTSSSAEPPWYDFATIKYDAETGEELWVARTSSPDYDHVATAIALDDSGNVYVTGYRYDTGTQGYATAKYDGATGTELWLAKHGFGRARGIAVDAAGDAYVTGESWAGNRVVYLTIKYDGATGDSLWAAHYGGPGNGNDYANAIALDANGNVYVTGDSRGHQTGSDFATVIYDGATGEELWVARYNGPSNSWDGGSAIALDAAGNVYVTGSSWSDGTEFDFATIRYCEPLALAEDRDAPAEPGLTPGRFNVRWASPNPLTTGIATLRFEGLGHVPRLTVRVFDVSGRNVLSRSLYVGHRESGIPLDLRKVPAGAYLVRVDAAGHQETLKLVVQR